MKSTKKSLIASALSLVLCVSMLLGTTYAWFTDSVTSGKNKIIAGNLDVELTHSNAAVTNQPVQDATDLFGVALWEPGVIAWENLTVTNVGNLALKYALNLNVFDKNATTEGHDLTEVIKVAVIDGGFKPTGTTAEAKRTEAQALSFGTLADFQKTGNLAGGDSTGDTFGVVLYWQPTDNDNLYNLKNGLASTDGQPLFVEFGVNLVATQDTVENDSFDDQYDVSAELPVIASFPNIKKADVTDASKSLKINKQGALESAEVKATGAKTVFESLEDKTEGRTNDMTLTLSVNETGSKEKEVEGGKEKTLNFDINMSAIMKVTNTSTGALIDTKKNDNVEKLDEFTTIKLKIGKYSSVSVLHKSVAMEKLDSATAIPTDTKNGGYFYDGEEFVYVVTKTFSPFTFKCVTEKTKLYYTTANVGGKDVKVVSFAGKEWVVLNEDSTTNTALVLMKDNLSAGAYGPKGTTNYAILYKNSDLDTAMNNYYDSLSEENKSCIALSNFKESIVVNMRDESGTPSKYLEAGDPELDTLISELKLQGVAFNSTTNTYTMERYVFAPSAKEMRDFGYSKLASVANGGILDYSKVGTYSDQAFFTRSAETTRTGFVITPANTGAEDYSYGAMPGIGYRPALRLDLNKVQFAQKAD